MAKKPRQTRSQREWDPDQPKPPRSVKALFASSVLCLEGALMFFFGLAAWGLNQNEWFAWWIFGGACVLAVVCVMTCAVLHKPWGYAAGWALQGVIIASFVAGAMVTAEGLVMTMAVLPGMAFAACWWYAVDKGAQLDVEKMERYRLEQRLNDNEETDS
ncbi:DUF4233 domain-containing protein [Nesterenkonia sp. MY13]|uniref:DUF4233 domain-containing protein n=1 Tax=Nesterenkonia sedimenti TaxID=1463632 RepID=A0A7X8TK71_9MICC|nr:DUF4233 domain-containing protein [Nesterenkonia sedimenti]NLS10050.1 DUF4233 domain-containing protein [Nesterenkonia sedimenti]